MRFKNKKRCPYCKCVLPLSSFAYMKDTGDPICSDCEKPLNKEDFRNNLPLFKEVVGHSDTFYDVYEVKKRGVKDKTFLRRRVVQLLENCVVVRDYPIEEDLVEGHIEEYIPDSCNKARFRYVWGAIHVIEEYPEVLRSNQTNIF